MIIGYQDESKGAVPENAHVREPISYDLAVHVISPSRFPGFWTEGTLSMLEISGPSENVCLITALSVVQSGYNPPRTRV